MTGKRSSLSAARVPLAPAPTGGSEPAGDSEWRLPSGEDLISFALAAGIAACPLLEAVPVSGSEDERPQVAAVRSGGRRAK
jgi:hypothetical protein